MSPESWLQGPRNVLGTSVELESLRLRLHGMTDAEFLTFGTEMHELVYPLTYGNDRKPSVSAFSIQLNEAREEWRKRRPQLVDDAKSSGYRADDGVLVLRKLAMQDA